MNNTETRQRADSGSVSINAGFFQTLDKIHADFDAAISAQQLVDVANHYTSQNNPAINSAVTVSFLSRCAAHIGDQPAMTSDDFTRMERLSDAWDAAPRSKVFYEAIAKELRQSADCNDRLLADVAILLILKEEYPGLPVRQAIAAFGQASLAPQS